MLEFLRTCFWLSNHFSSSLYLLENTHDLSRFLCSFGKWESGPCLCSEVTAVGTILWHCSYPPGGDDDHPHSPSWLERWVCLTTPSNTSLKGSDISDSLACGHSYWKYHSFKELARIMLIVFLPCQLFKNTLHKHTAWWTVQIRD